MILLTFMYTARSARYDVLKGVCFLAKYITIWDTDCDWRLHRLMCCIYEIEDDVMMGFIGDHPTDLTPHIFCDADFAGDPYSLKSTSGCHCDIQGPNSRFPTGSIRGGQTAIAASSTEAELASLHLGLRSRGEGALSILAVILGHYHKMERQGPLNNSDECEVGFCVGADLYNCDWPLPIYVNEDDQTCITCVVTWKTLP